MGKGRKAGRSLAGTLCFEREVKCRRIEHQHKCTEPSEPEGRDGGQNEAPIIEGRMVSDLFHHLDTHTSLWGWMGFIQGY